MRSVAERQMLLALRKEVRERKTERCTLKYDEKSSSLRDQSRRVLECESLINPNHHFEKGAPGCFMASDSLYLRICYHTHPLSNLQDAIEGTQKLASYM